MWSELSLDGLGYVFIGSHQTRPTHRSTLAQEPSVLGRTPLPSRLVLPKIPSGVFCHFRCTTAQSLSLPRSRLINSTTLPWLIAYMWLFDWTPCSLTGIREGDQKWITARNNLWMLQTDDASESNKFSPPSVMATAAGRGGQTIPQRAGWLFDQSAGLKTQTSWLNEWSLVCCCLVGTKPCRHTALCGIVYPPLTKRLSVRPFFFFVFHKMLESQKPTCGFCFAWF